MTDTDPFAHDVFTRLKAGNTDPVGINSMERGTPVLVLSPGVGHVVDLVVSIDGVQVPSGHEPSPSEIKSALLASDLPVALDAYTLESNTRDHFVGSVQDGAKEHGSPLFPKQVRFFGAISARNTQTGRSSDV